MGPPGGRGYEARIAGAFRMDNAAWARHASPWSVWTRIPLIFPLVLAIWSRTWIGWWALLPVALLLAWTWWNPRAFPPPRSTDNWASKAVLGERVWLNRRAVPIPARHRVVPHLLNALAAAGGLLLAYGLIVLDAPATLLGTALAFLGKMWFVDRMVWLFEDMKDADPAYRSWLY